MKEPCITKLPDRKQAKLLERHNAPKPKPYRFDYCKCGHTWGKHGWRYIIFSDGKCRKCVCDRFKSIGKFSVTEIEDVKVCNEENN